MSTHLISMHLTVVRVVLTNPVMTALMVYELVRNNQLTGSVIATSPQFNYMIGPSSEVLINIGARFIPSVYSCMPPWIGFGMVLMDQLYEASRSSSSLLRAILLLYYQVSHESSRRWICRLISSPPDRTCSIEEICGHGGFPGGEPDRESFQYLSSCSKLKPPQRHGVSSSRSFCTSESSISYST